MSTAGRSHRAARTRRLHWKAPILMVVSFLTAIISAVSHHILYFSMDGRVVTDEFEQQVVTSAGSALAFMVKAMLALSSALAFFQCLWFSLRSRSIKIRRMDSLFGTMGNPFEFLDLRFWLGHPVLFLTAVSPWLMPLAAVFAPATISVSQKAHATQVITNVTQRVGYIAEFMRKPTDGAWQYPGTPNSLVYINDLGNAGGNILSIPGGSPNQNLTYSLEFFAPALNCIPPSEQTRSFILSAMGDYISTAEEFVFYSAFNPVEGFGPGLNSSFFSDVILGLTRDTFYGLDTVSDDGAKVYFSLWVDNTMTAIPDETGYMELIECTLHNASYNTQVELRGNGQQTISTEKTIHEPLTSMLSLPDTMSEADAAKKFEALAIMQIYVNNVLGATTTSPVYATLPDANSVQFSQLANNPVLSPYLAPSTAPVDFDQFKAGVEALFQNLTLSYRFGFIPDTFLLSGRADTPEFNSFVVVPGTVSVFHNTFIYSPTALITAYALAIFLSALCLVCGLVALYSNGASYTNNFSTVLRMTRDPRFGDFISDEEECAGLDPLPSNIADVEITYMREAAAGGEKAQDGESFISGLRVVRPT